MGLLNEGIGGRHGDTFSHYPLVKDFVVVVSVLQWVLLLLLVLLMVNNIVPLRSNGSTRTRLPMNRSLSHATTCFSFVRRYFIHNDVPSGKDDWNSG